MDHIDTARSRLLLAPTLAHAHRPKTAEKVVRAALDKYPDDVACRLMLVALLLQRSDQSPTLFEAIAHLTHVGPLLPACQDRKLWVDYYVLYAAFDGLYGERAAALKILDMIPDPDRRRDRVHEMREALTQPVSITN